jgi:hypothetical protein
VEVANGIQRVDGSERDLNPTRSATSTVTNLPSGGLRVRFLGAIGLAVAGAQRARDRPPWRAPLRRLRLP